jgi:hypothetical protein
MDGVYTLNTFGLHWIDGVNWMGWGTLKGWSTLDRGRGRGGGEVNWMDGVH